MAATRLIALHVNKGRSVAGSLADRTDYAKNPEKTEKGELELLFVSPDVHGHGIGQAAWKAVEELHPEIRVWETITPYFEKRNIHFYVNRCGFQIVEFWNKHFHGPAVPEEESGNWSEDDEMFVFRKVINPSSRYFPL